MPFPVQQSTWAYDSQGRLVSSVISGATNDVVSSHVLLDPRVPGPVHVSHTTSDARTEEAVIPLLNAPTGVANKLTSALTQPRTTILRPGDPPALPEKMYKPMISATSPPRDRRRGTVDLLNPFSGDVGGVTVATPVLEVKRRVG